MATLTLTKLWINRVDTGESVSGYSSDRTRNHEVEGEIRTYAGGRQRAIRVTGERGEFAFTIRELSETDMETLRSWIGEVVQVRDHRGQRFVGVYFAVPVTEVKAPVLYNAAITLHTLTVADGV